MNFMSLYVLLLLLLLQIWWKEKHCKNNETGQKKAWLKEWLGLFWFVSCPSQCNVRLLFHKLQNVFVSKCICLKLQNVFVTNCKMYLSQISKCICLKLQNVYFPDTVLIKYLSTKQVSGGSQDKLCTILKCILSVKFIQLKQLFWRKRGICFPPPTLLYCF